MYLIRRKDNKRRIFLELAIKSTQEQLQLAQEVIKGISEGTFDAHHHVPEGELGKLLLTLHQEITLFKEEERRRRWVAEGLAKFVDIFKNDQNNKEVLYQKILSELIKYTDANQGGIFLVVQEGDEHNLEMVSSYAYGRKRYQEKKVRIGEGLLGQCFLEKESIFLTDIPNFYTHITSGLGEATPSSMLLVPMIYNDEVLGIVELMSFRILESYQIQFIEKIAESIASISFTMGNSARTSQLLSEAQLREQLLKEQEEEMRQNLEEMVAIQENMTSKQKEIDANAAMMKLIIDNIPFPVFVKDENGKYIHINIAEANLFKLTEKEILGKDDSFFVKDQEEWEVIKKSDAQVMQSDTPIELPMQSFTTSDGYKHVFKTSKIPFYNSLTGQKNILGVSVDMTEKVELEKIIMKDKVISNHSLLLDVAGRQRMLSQKIGFYAQMVARGKKQKRAVLMSAIELFEDSLLVIKKGGKPKEVLSNGSLPPAIDSMKPLLEQLSDSWERYKNNAEIILKENNKSDMEEALESIENESEQLLHLCNQFVLQCYVYMEEQAAKIDF